MGFTAYILLASIWIFGVWILFVVCAKFFKVLSVWPEYWLVSIFVSFGVPFLALGLLGIGVHMPEAIPSISTIAWGAKLSVLQNDSSVFHAVKIPALVIYCVGVVFALSRIFLGWKHVFLAARSNEKQTFFGRDVVFTHDFVPLCAFGFFRPVILVPQNLVDNLQFAVDSKIWKLLLAHEAAHIRYSDPLVMMCLLVMKAIFWPHPAIYDFMKRWQLSAELRADNTALSGETQKIRKQYGQILVTILRHEGAENSGRTLPSSGPCPSASLNLSNYRSAKMRVNNILNDNLEPRKTVWLKFKMVALAFITTLLGAYGLVAAASPAHTSDRDAQPSVRFPPIFPANCTANEGKFAASVVVKFDVNKAGNVENVRVTKSDNTCFDQASINSTLKWKYAPVLHKGKPRKRKNVQAMIIYKLSGN